MIATAGGALFLTQLEQVVLGMGAPSSVQLVIQGSIIALGMALHTAPWHRVRGAAASAGSALRQRETPPRPPLPDLGDGGRP